MPAPRVSLRSLQFSGHDATWTAGRRIADFWQGLNRDWRLALEEEPEIEQLGQFSSIFAELRA